MSKLSIRSIIPNITTLIGLCFGILAICFALSGQFKLSVICIMMASICDVLDGRLSRLLKSESKLGAELDSLADFLNFGIAPSILIYMSLLQNAGLIERVAVLSFIVFSCLRLARFNADIDSNNNIKILNPIIEDIEFTGIKNQGIIKNLSESISLKTRVSFNEDQLNADINLIKNILKCIINGDLKKH